MNAMLDRPHEAPTADGERDCGHCHRDERDADSDRHPDATKR